MPTVRIPIPLRKYTDGHGDVSVQGSTVGEAFEDLTGRYPDLSDYLYDDADEFVTTTYESINVFAGTQDVRELAGVETQLKETDRLLIVRTWPATMSGGRQWNKPVGEEAPQG